MVSPCRIVPEHIISKIPGVLAVEGKHVIMDGQQKVSMTLGGDICGFPCVQISDDIHVFPLPVASVDRQAHDVVGEARQFRHHAVPFNGISGVIERDAFQVQDIAQELMIALVIVFKGFVGGRDRSYLKTAGIQLFPGFCGDDLTVRNPKFMHKSRKRIGNHERGAGSGCGHFFYGNSVQMVFMIVRTENIVEDICSHFGRKRRGHLSVRILTQIRVNADQFSGRFYRDSGLPQKPYGQQSLRQLRILHFIDKFLTGPIPSVHGKRLLSSLRSTCRCLFLYPGSRPERQEKRLPGFSPNNSMKQTG